MPAHQVAMEYEAALRMLDRGLSCEHGTASDQVEVCRCNNAAVRLMGAFNDAAPTLHSYGLADRRPSRSNSSQWPKAIKGQSVKLDA